MADVDHSVGPPGALAEDDAALCARAAWLYHAGGFTQSQVAEQLGVTGAKAHRLISRATRAGLVRVFVDGSIGSCIAQETALMRRFGLDYCRVVPTLGEAGLPLRALGIAGAGFLRDALEGGTHRIVGVGHGRTLASVVAHTPQIAVRGLRLVSLLGGLPRRYYTNPFEVIDRLAEKTGSDAHLLPVPLLAARAADRDVLRRQLGVEDALRLASEATLIVVGIGEANAEAFLTGAGVVSQTEIGALHRAGAVGECLGYIYDSGGKLVDTKLHDRITGLSIDALRAASGHREIVAIAGGPSKDPAITAVLRSRLLTGLITDEPTARRIVAAES